MFHLRSSSLLVSVATGESSSRFGNGHRTFPASQPATERSGLSNIKLLYARISSHCNSPITSLNTTRMSNGFDYTNARNNSARSATPTEQRGRPRHPNCGKSQGAGCGNKEPRCLGGGAEGGLQD